MNYKVWIKQHGKSAVNAGTIYGQAEPRDKRGWWFCEVTANSDDHAFSLVSQKSVELHRDRRPLAGKSYMRHCRVKT